MATTGAVARGLFLFPWIQYDRSSEDNRDLLHYQAASHSGADNLQDPPLNTEDGDQGEKGFENDSDPQSILFLVFMAVLVFAWCLCLFSGLVQDASSAECFY